MYVFRMSSSSDVFVSLLSGVQVELLPEYANLACSGWRVLTRGHCNKAGFSCDRRSFAQKQQFLCWHGDSMFASGVCCLVLCAVT